jgi:acyl-CoA reductase-like NAD-dependent aldehyde dehydrogenase
MALMSTIETPAAQPLTDVTRRCRRAQQEWAARPIRHRLQPVRALRRLLVDHCDAFCEAVQSDIGKPCAETLAGELLPLVEACRFLERRAARLLRPRRVPMRQRPIWLWGQSDRVLRRPRGLVGIIGTWNYPFLLNGIQIVQALTAGNGVLWKPSEVAPNSAAVLQRAFGEAGFPAELLHVLPTTREAGRELADADVDHVIFTGAETTGRHLAAALGRRLVTSTLELSGCDALFVLDDADVQLAARAVWWGATLNRGQTCLAVRRALVHRDRYPDFVEALRPLVTATPPQRLALAAQAQHAESLVRDAVAAGARVLVGQPGPAVPSSPERNGATATCSAVAVVDVQPGMALCREASFAPLLAVLPFDDLDEALRINAQCPFGLAASVFTRRPARAVELADRLKVGTVTVNDVILPTVHPATPFGGQGAAGWGVTQGAEGLLELTVPQVVSIRSGSYRPHYEPAGSTRLTHADTLRGLLEWGHASTVGRRWRGLWRALRSLWTKG